MRRSRTKRGQTLVEFAMILPLLLAIIMAIIDFSYIVYNWAEVQFAARRGAEQAQKFPPKNTFRRTLDNPAGDDCAFQLIRREVYRNGAFSRATGLSDNEIEVVFLRDADGNPETANGVNPDASNVVQIAGQTELRVQDGPMMEIYIDHRVRPLTPLGESLFGEMRITAASRRTITSLQSDLATCS